MTDFTKLIADFSAGKPDAADRILEIVYSELRRLAAAKLARESDGITLQPTALVHEAWLRIGGQSGADWRNRSYFFAACGEAMRRILVDHARSRGRLKRGGDRERVELDAEHAAASTDSVDLLALDEALDMLAQESPRKARLVELRFFAGLGVEEAAAALSISKATADRDWAYAKAFLYQAIHSEDDTGPPPQKS